MSSRIGRLAQGSAHPVPYPASRRTFTSCPPPPKQSRGSDHRAARDDGSQLKRGVIVALRATPAFHKKCGGFTLLEMLMSLVLLALLLAGAYGGIRTSVRAMHSGEHVIERVDRMRTVQGFLRHQLSRILPLPYEQTLNSNYVFEGARDFMRFVAPMPGYLSHGGPYVQTLALTRGTDGLQLVFSDAMLNGFDPKEEKAAERDPVVLLDHIRDGAFSYRMLDEQGQLTQWSSSWDDPGVTPLMIQIELVMQNGERIGWPTLSVPLMLDSGATRVTAVAPKLMPTPGGVVR
jgi:general secretion pathway protein J